MNDGFILLSRTLLDSDVFASQKLLKIWIWCLCKANFKDRSVPLKVGKGETIIKVKRGSFIFGRFRAEEELFIDGSTIYKSMKKLQEMNMVKIESNNQYSIVTICKYDEYQQSDNYQVTSNEQPSNNQVTANEQPSNTTKNDNKVNKDNKDNNIKFDFKKSLIDLGVDENIVNDYIIVRKNKRLSNTETAFKKINDEIIKSKRSANDVISICVEKSWGGFNHKWLDEITDVKTVKKVYSVDNY